MEKKMIILAALAVVVVMNIAAFVLMGHDKKMARKGKWRVPEKTLFLVTACFGGLGDMSLDSVMQLQGMNQMMKGQFASYPVTSAMVLGVAGGNGLEHVDIQKYHKVYGIDINADYLSVVKIRHQNLKDILECLCIDLANEVDKLPRADLLIANLLIEYIGYERFQKAVEQVTPLYVSCIIQINTAEGQWVSDSPYLHAFDRLDEIHHQISEDGLNGCMEQMQFGLIKRVETVLPNGKKLIQMDYGRSIPAFRTDALQGADIAL